MNNCKYCFHSEVCKFKPVNECSNYVERVMPTKLYNDGYLAGYNTVLDALNDFISDYRGDT